MKLLGLLEHNSWFIINLRWSLDVPNWSLSLDRPSSIPATNWSSQFKKVKLVFGT